MQVNSFLGMEVRPTHTLLCLPAGSGKAQCQEEHLAHNSISDIVKWQLALAGRSYASPCADANLGRISLPQTHWSSLLPPTPAPTGPGSRPVLTQESISVLPAPAECWWEKGCLPKKVAHRGPGTFQPKARLERLRAAWAWGRCTSALSEPCGARPGIRRKFRSRVQRGPRNQRLPITRALAATFRARPSRGRAPCCLRKGPCL